MQRRCISKKQIHPLFHAHRPRHSYIMFYILIPRPPRAKGARRRAAGAAQRGPYCVLLEISEISMLGPRPGTRK